MNNRTAMTAAVFVEVDQEILEEDELRNLSTLDVFAPEVFGIGGKTFIQPDLSPVFARHQIAPPLMRQFMGDDVVIVYIERGAIVEQTAVCKGRSRGVLHCAAEKIVHHNL